MKARVHSLFFSPIPNSIYAYGMIRIDLSHRCIAPAVIFSNGRADGHALACLTILFTYTHVHKTHTQSNAEK